MTVFCNSLIMSYPDIYMLRLHTQETKHQSIKNILLQRVTIVSQEALKERNEDVQVPTQLQAALSAHYTQPTEDL